jgi:hypothetical protein
VEVFEVLEVFEDFWNPQTIRNKRLAGGGPRYSYRRSYLGLLVEFLFATGTAKIEGISRKL